MTINEVVERVVRIWGPRRMVSARLRADGGADVNLAATEAPGNDVHGRNYAAHRLDRNGHATCHEECAQLEAAYHQTQHVLAERDRILWQALNGRSVH